MSEELYMEVEMWGRCGGGGDTVTGFTSSVRFYEDWCFVKGFTSEVIWGGGVFLGECFDSGRGFYLEGGRD